MFEGKPAPVHAVFVQTDDPRVFRHLHDFAHTPHDFIRKLPALRLQFVGHGKAHDPHHPDPQFLHPRDRPAHFFITGFGFPRDRVTPVGNAAAVAVETDSGLRQQFLHLREFLVRDRGQIAGHELARLDPGPAQLLRCRDLSFQRIRCLVRKTCEIHNPGSFLP